MSEKLTPTQSKAIAALLETPTLELAAAAVRVNPRTLYRWMRQDVFKKALTQAEGELLDKISRRLLAMGDTALDALADVINTPDQPGASNKRMAASDVLSRLMTLRELVTLDERVRKLEDANVKAN